MMLANKQFSALIKIHVWRNTPRPGKMAERELRNSFLMIACYTNTLYEVNERQTIERVRFTIGGVKLHDNEFKNN